MMMIYYSSPLTMVTIPTWNGTDHTRELVPILGYSPRMNGPIDLGDRKSFADIGETILENFGLKTMGYWNIVFGET